MAYAHGGATADQHKPRDQGRRQGQAWVVVSRARRGRRNPYKSAQCVIPKELKGIRPTNPATAGVGGCYAKPRNLREYGYEDIGYEITCIDR